MKRVRDLALAGVLLFAAFAAAAPPAKDEPEGDPRQSKASSDDGSGFRLESDAFRQGGDIPEDHTCDGADRSPALRWTGAPADTKSFALIVDDPDAPSKTFVHWIVFNVPGAAGALGEDVDRSGDLGDGTRQGKNDFKSVGWNGPCPPQGSKHRYRFRLYALSTTLELEPAITRKELEAAIEGKQLATAELTGTYRRKKSGT